MMKKIFILSVLILCIANFAYAVGPTKYTSQQVLNLSFRDSDGNTLSFATQLSAQNVLNLCFNDETNVLNCAIVGEFVISTITSVATIYWVDGSTWTSTSINMGDVSITYTNFKIAISTDFAVSGNFYVAPGTAYTSTGNVDGSWDFGGATTAQGDVSSDANSLNEVAVSTKAIVDNSERINSLAGTSVIQYLYSAEATSFGYYATSTTPQASAVTRNKTLSGTGIIVSSWVISMGDITTVPSGEWHVEFYANVNNPNSTTIWFDIYDGTGAAIAQAGNFIMSTALSSALTQTIAEYFVYVTTNQYSMRTEYLSLVMKANEVGANPILSYAMGGSYDAHLHFPVIRGEVSVTQIIGGTDINITPTNGRGDVTINSDSLHKSTGTSVEQNITNIEDLQKSSAPFTVIHYNPNTGELTFFTGIGISTMTNAGWVLPKGYSIMLDTMNVNYIQSSRAVNVYPVFVFKSSVSMVGFDFEAQNGIFTSNNFVGRYIYHYGNAGCRIDLQTDSIQLDTGNTRRLLADNYGVHITTLYAQDSDGLWFRTDGRTGGFHLHDDGSMDAKGSWNMEGHDVNGADDIAGASLSVIGGFAISGADGDDGDVLTSDGAGGVTLEAPAGGAGGNKNREINKMAESFVTSGFTQNASIVLKQFEVTYSGVASTSAVYYIKCPDSAEPNHAFTSFNMSKQWDDGTVDVYIAFKTSSTSSGNLWTELGISTCPFVENSFEMYDATTTVGSGWCDFKVATITIPSSSVLFDGKDITVHLGRKYNDSCPQTVFYKNCKFDYDVD